MKIKLLAEHRHDGVNYAKGTIPEVPDETAHWLVAIGNMQLIGGANYLNSTNQLTLYLPFIPGQTSGDTKYVFDTYTKPESPMTHPARRGVLAIVGYIQSYFPTNANGSIIFPSN